MLTLTCTTCQKKLSVKEELAGKKVKCPGCGAVLAVPLSASVGILDQPTLPSESPSQASPSQINDPPTNPSLSNPANTLANETPDNGHDANLTDFLAPPQADDELGRLGKYRILKILGHGGMGVVYQAEDPRLKRTVALKAMLPTLAASASSGKRFLREAEAMAAVEHDHIVRIYQIDEERGVPFMAMEFLKGQPLDERLKRDTKLPALEVLRIGREIAEALGAAHAKGLIHRDIKPANIWLEAPRDRVKILDFGLARAAAQESGLTQQGAIIGTPAYMAPEQARGDAVDARTDLFSLGVVLYRLSTGQQPFQGKDTVSMLMDVATHHPIAPVAINVALPQQLSELVMKLLEKDPAKRIATADEVVQALEGMEKEIARQQAAKEQTIAESYVAAKQTSAIAGKPIASDRRSVLSSPSGRGTGDEGGPRRRKLPRVLAALLLLGLLGGATFAIIVLFWRTANGVVRIEINDPDIEVAVSKTGAVIKGADKHDLTLAAGEHFLKIKRGDFEFDTDKFILKKGETITLKVEWFKDGKLQVVQGDRVIGAKTATPNKGPEKLITNTLGMKFVYIPPGKFIMGSSPQEIDRCLRIGDWARDQLPTEGPEHPVEITQGFYLGATEVTVGQFRKFVEEKKYNVGDNRWKPPALGEFEDHPVAWVSWQNAVDFCNWLSEKEGKQYRLPTEAQWEYSCRAGKAGTRYWFGDDESQLENYAWYAKNSPKGRSPVATKKPNEWGLYDMHGSQWEWCQDIYDANYYKISPKQDPQGPAGAAGKRVTRGGSHFDHLPYVCRSAFRFHGDPSSRSFNYGFRVLLAPGTPIPPAPVQPALLYSIPWNVAEQGLSAHLWQTGISSDGRLLFAAGDSGPNGAIRLWELATGKQVQELVLGGQPWFHKAEFLPGSKQLVASYQQFKDLYLWDIDSGKVVRTFVGHDRPDPYFVLSRDGKRLLSWSDDKTARLWDVETGKELQKLEGHADRAAGVFSPDGTQVLTFSPDKTLRLWNVESGKELKKLVGHTESPTGCFFPDGKQALSYGPDQTIRLWDLKTGEEIRKFGETLFKVNFAGFVADGRRVVGNTADGKFRVWETASGKLMREIDYTQFGENGVTITASPDGRLALVSHSDGSVRVLDLETGKEIHRYNQCPLARAFSFSPDGTLAVAGSFRRGVFVFRLPGRRAAAALAPLPQTHSIVQKFQGHAGPIYSVALSGDGKQVLTGSGDRTAILWDAASGKKLQTFEGHADVVGTAVLSSDSKHVLTGSHDATAALWDAETGKNIQTLAGHNASVRGLALSGDGKYVLTGSYDRTAALWDAKTGKKIQTFQGHTHEIWCVALSSDAKLVLTGARDRTAILWDAATAKKLQTFQGHTDGLQSVALSRDGKRILTGSWDSTAILWDASSGKPLQTFRGHAGRVTGVALSDDGNLVLTGSLDNSAILWDATTGKKLQTLQGHTGPVEHAAMTGDGRFVLTGAQDQQAILWRLGPSLGRD